MRSIMSFAVLAAAIGFSGCCGTGAKCPLSHGGKVSHASATTASVGDCGSSAPAMQYAPAASDCGCSAPAMQYEPAPSDCGCSAPAMQYAPAPSDCSAPVSDCGCGSVSAAPVSGSCGCGDSGCGAPASSSAAACACGGDMVTTVSAPYACGGDCGGGGAATMAAPVSYDGGCSSCGDSAPMVSPAQFSPAAAPSGGCTTCQGASNRRSERPGLRGRLANNLGGAEGMGMTMSENGLACGGAASSIKNARSLKPKKRCLAEKLGLRKSKAAAAAADDAEYELVNNEIYGDCTTCQGAVIGDTVPSEGRHISHGFISDVRNAHQGRARGHIGGIAGKHGCGAGGCGLGGHGGHRGHAGAIAGGIGGNHGCGVAGCGQGGRLCALCSKARSVGGFGLGNPYGGAIPHTTQQPGQSGLAPSYAYPYYTTRGPRDFLRDNPPSIGR